ncbi:MAG: PAS domain S-box protein [Acidobacteriota bacterium]
MTPGAPSEHPIRILLVEDDSVDVAAIRRALGRGGVNADVTALPRAEDALELLGSGPVPFEVLLTDHRLPGTSGLELCREVLARRIPIGTVMLTGAGSEHLAVKALKAGVDEYLIKDTRNRYLELLTALLPEVVRRHRARLAHGEAQATLRHLAAIVESSHDAIVGHGLDLAIISWNPAAERIFGWRADEVVGKPLTMLLPQDHREEMPRMMERLVAGERIENYETLRRRKDGSLLDVSLTVSPIRDGDGELRGASAIVRDITDKRRAEAAQRRAHREMEAFLFRVSNDLRTPLLSVRGMLELMREDLGRDAPEGNISEDLLTYFEHIDRSTTWMGRLLEDLAEMSQVGHTDTTPSAVDPRRIVDQVVVEARDRARDTSLDVGIADGFPTLWCNPKRLRQVFSNLVDNAIKFGGRDGAIQIGWRPADAGERHAVLFVQDRGPGIPRSEQSRIFEMFYRRQGSEGPGTGMGLAFAKRILESMGGAIWVESAVGQGSAFLFHLPRSRT